MKKKAKFLLYHISKKEGVRVLLGLRQADENESYWWMPGGSVEQNESNIMAGWRELNEELNIDEQTSNTITSYIDNGIFIPNLSYSTEKSENTVFFIDIGPLEEEPLFTIKEEFSEVKWFSVNNLPVNMSREFQNINNFLSEKWLKSISQI